MRSNFHRARLRITASLAGYPFSMINALVSAGLLHIYFCPTRYRAWSPTFRASWGVVFFFFISNVFLVVAPLLPPPLEADNVYEKLPYYSHCIGGVAVFGLGALYWLVWARLLPRLGSYRLAQITTIGRDGWSRRLIQGVPRAPKIPESHKSEQVHRDLKDEDMWI